MKITKVESKLFQYTSYVESDDEGHGHPAKDPHKVKQSLITIETDEGYKGHSFGANPEIVENGDYVVCAVSGKDIPLNKLTYWNVELQEAYFSYIEATIKREELSKKT